MREDSPLAAYMALMAVFVPFSLVAIGGGPSVFAPMQREAVDVRNWLSAREFIEIFAIARVAPGPGSMLATLIGWKVAGWGGALVATAAIFVPSSIVCLGVSNVWNRYRGRAWHKALETGLAPIGTGLMFAGVLAIFRLAGAGPLAWGTAFVVAGLLTFRPRVHPFALLLLGAVAFNIALFFAR
ncbi:MAG: Chromate transport protein ChrA [Hyphomicrobiales bacterium]|jgi:chromate transporter|nr:Chromate transport protein ChrA [Hyphomicrobiales bacterium]